MPTGGWLRELDWEACYNKTQFNCQTVAICYKTIVEFVIKIYELIANPINKLFILNKTEISFFL